MNALRIALFRTSVALAAIAVAIAIVLGALSGTAPSLRRSIRNGLVYVTRDFHQDRDRGPLFVEPGTGRLEALKTANGESLGAVSLAPWHDAEGRTHAVGHWMSFRGRDAERTLEAAGLARFRFPDGEPLERVASQIVPTGPPCWLPGTAARVVFTSGDGQLYRFAFEGSSDAGADILGCDRAPRPLMWRVEGPDPEKLYFSDLSSPANGPLAASGLILASLRASDDSKRSSNSQLCWLRLDPTGSEVVSWGPLIRPEAVGPGIDLRYPTLARGADGRTRLAYLDRQVPQRTWRLRLAEIEIDEATGNPTPLDGPGDVLAEGCSPSSPAFSADGEWLCCIRRPGAGGPVVARLPLGRARGELASAGAIVPGHGGRDR